MTDRPRRPRQTRREFLRVGGADSGNCELAHLSGSVVPLGNVAGSKAIAWALAISPAFLFNR